MVMIQCNCKCRIYEDERTMSLGKLKNAELLDICLVYAALNMDVTWDSVACLLLQTILVNDLWLWPLRTRRRSLLRVWSLLLGIPRTQIWHITIYIEGYQIILQFYKWNVPFRLVATIMLHSNSDNSANILTIIHTDFYISYYNWYKMNISITSH